jgi:hypothetical protein
MTVARLRCVEHGHPTQHMCRDAGNYFLEDARQIVQNSLSIYHHNATAPVNGRFLLLSAWLSCLPHTAPATNRLLLTTH